MNASVYHEKLSRALARGGGFYGLSDLLERIADKRMQSFSCNNSWVVTQINQFPRKRMLDVVAAVGDLEDCRALHDQVVAFAEAEGADLIRAIGRRGWMPDATMRGWRPISTNVVYLKELEP